MTHVYAIDGMTCGSCVSKVKDALLRLPDVLGVEVSKEEKTAEITMSKHISLSELQEALDPKYTISPMQAQQTHASRLTPTGEMGIEGTASPFSLWLQTYKPILLIFGYITLISLISAIRSGDLGIQDSQLGERTMHLGEAGHTLELSKLSAVTHVPAYYAWMHGMNVFMAGFFLTFSFFKMLDLKAFAESYSMYDIVAKRVKAWGYIYPFVELALGVFYATGFQPIITNVATLVVMGVSILGVLQSVLSKRTIQCACLGAVFNLPMSTVTIIEDGLMILMSALMLMTSF